jgi:CRISPR-associated endonuclease/helicase Cas3
MSEDFLAHSARPEKGIPPQGYAEHIRASRENARRYGEACGRYSGHFGTMLETVAGLAGEYHDLGKLDEANQAVLRGDVEAGRLPVPHVDAAPACLLEGDQAAKLAALICYSHHRGLPSMPHESNRGSRFLRDERPEWVDHINRNLAQYLHRHRECVGEAAKLGPVTLDGADFQMLLRIALSCQADADHGDTAEHYSGATPARPPDLRAAKRLSALDAYVERLRRAHEGGTRTELRTKVYRACREADTSENIYSCAAPVGAGKTTAVMAHMLNVACKRNLRRIFVILPYTNIISEAVHTYRQALVLPGERGEEVVVEHHHRADYDSPTSRALAELWDAPIVVTTAVQFFETLASNRPARLRKLHRLPGSAVFIDEAHAALPAHLWPQTWLWLDELRRDWSCHFVLASGSLTRFWELPDFHPKANPARFSPPRVKEIVPDNLMTEAVTSERSRIVYRTAATPMNMDGFIDWISSFTGPRLAIINTVQSAAAIARAIEGRFDNTKIEHLSTALTPTDRGKTLKRIRERLSNREDSDWTLVATSCVEAGVNLSFRVGFRERAGLVNLVQVGGRINRGHSQDAAEVWDFMLMHDHLLRAHPALVIQVRVLTELFQENKVNIASCKEALRREVRWNESRLKDDLTAAENSGNMSNADFEAVAAQFQVIDSATVTATVNEGLKARLRAGRHVSRRELQMGSVQLWGRKVNELRLPQFPAYPGVYEWNLDYDSFLGYMAGLLPIIEFSSGSPTVI